MLITINDSLASVLMYIRIITIGKPKISFAQEGFSLYIHRLKGFHKVDVVHIDDGLGAGKKCIAMIRKDSQFQHILFDEGGTQLTSQGMAHALESYGSRGETHISFYIGGPDGHSDDLRKLVPVMWSLSRLTLPHDLAMLFASESLYRASTIIAGHPYHRI